MTTNVWRTALLASALGPACVPCPACPEPYTAPVATITAQPPPVLTAPPATGLPELTIEPVCAIAARRGALPDDARLVVFGLVQGSWTSTETRAAEGIYHDVYRITCSWERPECRGTQIRLDDRQLTILEVTELQAITLTNATTNVYTLSFGPWRTFTLDASLGELEFRESGPTTDGRGKMELGNCVVSR